MSIPTVTPSSAASFPPEISLSIFSFLAPQHLPQLKCICSDYKKLIESDASSQVRIAELYLRKKSFHANIPLLDLKYFVQNTNLALEIKGDANIFHLTTDLTFIIPWISNLIIKNCDSTNLDKLLNLLKLSKQLSILSLYGCKINHVCKNNLLELINCQIKNQKTLKLFYGNIEWDSESNQPLSPPSEMEGIKIIPNEDIDQFDIENLENSNEELEEFEQQVLDPKAPANVVLKVFDSIKNIARAEIVRSIWHSILMPLNEDLMPIDFIANQARLYIEKNPHHPAIIAAARTSKCRNL